MARVHDLLSKSENSQRVDLAAYVTSLCDALRSLTGDGERIRLKAAAVEDIQIDADTAFPLGIVLTEWITNAVKYAFPAPSAGTILVDARNGPAGWLELRVQYDGVGMMSPRKGSLGYALVRSLVRQIKGEIDIRDEDGLTVTISVPR